MKTHEEYEQLLDRLFAPSPVPARRTIRHRHLISTEVVRLQACALRNGMSINLTPNDISWDYLPDHLRDQILDPSRPRFDVVKLRDAR